MTQPEETAAIPPPRWMTRSEKSDFRRVIDARKAAGRPVMATEFDTICDFVSSRSRLAFLRRLTKEAVRQCREDPLERFKLHPLGHQPEQRHAMAVIRQTEAAAAHSRRLARDLGLVGTE